MNTHSNQPDILAAVGAPAALSEAVGGHGYRRVGTSDSGIALWTRSDDVRITTRTDLVASTAFFGVTTTPNPLEVLNALPGDLSVVLGADPFVIVGHFAAMRLEAGSLGVLTDHLGSVPVYFASANARSGGWIVGTNLTDVALLAGRTDIDPVSAFEFVHEGMITSPHSIFADVSRVGPGTLCTFAPDETPGPATEIRYWCPAPAGSPTDLGEAANAIAATMRANLGALSSQFSRLVLLMSGGEDSRILAKTCRALNPRSNDLRGVIFIDAPNREWRLANSAARMIGVELSARTRAADHYTNSIPASVSLVGGGIDLTHAHSIGLVEPDEADLFVDGWAADSIYKAHTYKRKSLRIQGVQLSLEKPDVTPSPVGPEDWIHHETGSQVLLRREAKRSQLLEFRSPLEADAWMSLWPISDHRDYGFFASNWRSRPSVSPFLFANMVASATAVSAEQLMNRQLFHRAFSSLLGTAGWIPRTGGQIPRLGARSNLVATNVVKVVFRFMSQVERWRGGTVAQGPWQSFTTRRAAVSEAMAAAPPSLLLEADRLARGVSGEPDDHALSDAIGRWSTDQSNRVLQLSALLDQVRDRDD